MIALLSFFVILLLSLSIVRIAAIMLQLTGLSADTARFQARSAFTGTGFTTRESEMIIGHPVRRRIIMGLMLIGNLGLVTFVSSLVLTFLRAQSALEMASTGAILIGGLLLLFFVSKSRILDSLLSKIITRLLRRWTKLHTTDYDGLLNLSGDYEVIKSLVGPDSWCTERSLAELQLSDEGVLVLGIYRQDGYFIGSPKGSTFIYDGDELILYGRDERIRTLTDRKAGEKGDTEHREAVDAQNKIEGKRPAPLTISSRKGFRGFFRKREY
ncbi:TrkA C-terminal domain-containing protein [Sediminispirochaeta smaragdinae]|uniref:TrkA-C domain protein n=1 Tax=Sediminispirochaeta smaragdinae (strain DSM 11293 / JCM 15392 / SEBR 4228) TaxID=573413 RepID=E1R1P9_SEDSS|nr:TrkA C-terminal domain-containing protein [Sediminispirochaeta smaragdinae]ADK81425.1 TrkA-C domain protein [Sediminispirochaeta smaragdinae DSM 11293]